MRRSDEPEIHECAVCMRARARLRPRLLIGTRAGDVDTKADLSTGSEIERVYGGRHRCGATEKSISNQCGHAEHARLQSARLREQAGSCGLAPGQRRNFV